MATRLKANGLELLDGPYVQRRTGMRDTTFDGLSLQDIFADLARSLELFLARFVGQSEMCRACVLKSIHHQSADRRARVHRAHMLPSRTEVLYALLS